MARTANPREATAGGHVPVLLAEVVGSLGPVAGKRVVDGTFGAGGYSRALLAEGATICAIDRDPAAAAFAAPLHSKFAQAFQFVAGNFSELDTLCGDAADAVMLDIGVSSMQLDVAERGFSFMRDGPL
ncbi:MAG TPA: 16S rRNA (cytosine(1402)-N(4))-methyltransferase, partial [Devosiaceae bacterium]|nr:16S rRNA (cytosine(1402)-N(4))-methyltransferase [Devosiaceae bacterium]